MQPLVGVINCRDSFVFNLVQILREDARVPYIVISEERLAHFVEEGHLEQVTHLLLSPGPDLPSAFPRLMQLLSDKRFEKPILGVCLGMQALVSAYGGELSQIPLPKHGHKGELYFTESGRHHSFLKGIKEGGSIGRYHSWRVKAESLPDCFVVDAFDEEGNVAVLHHKEKPFYGVQFHPESIMTEQGKEMVLNWLKYCK